METNPQNGAIKKMVDQANADPVMTGVKPPEVAGEIPPDPSIIGVLTPEEMGSLTGLRQRSSQVTTEIGQLEIRKARMLGNLSEMEGQAQNIIQGAGKRLNIPDGQQFQVLADGKIRMMPSAPPARA